MVDSGATTPLRLIVGSSHFELSEATGSRDDFLRLKSLLDGRHTLAEIANRTGLTEPAVSQIVATLTEAGLMRRETATASIDAATFAQQVTASLDMWRRQIGFHRLFGLVESGEARLQVLQGLFIETYHVVRLASQHISVAVAHAESAATRTLLTGYLIDEHDHGPLLLETCVSLGVEADRLLESHPTVGSLGLINMLAELGRRDTLAYCAATCLFESTAGDYQDGAAAAERIRSAYGLQHDVLDPALQHLRMDNDANHHGLFAQAMAGYDDLPAARAHAIVNMLHDLKHSYDTHHDEILKYYSDISNYIPRPKVDFFSL